MRYFIVFWLSLIGWVTTAVAQDKDGVFPDYASYAQFVDQNMSQRNFTALILGLGGRDEFTDEQLANTCKQMEKAWPANFDKTTVFRKEDLGGGISQEGRIYWNGQSYAYYYALTHQRGDDLLVITFLINSSIKPVMARF